MDWLYLNFPSLQLDTLMEAHSPTAIVCTKHLKILQRNQSAAAKGIDKNMGLAMASALCGELQVHAYNLKLEQQQLEVLAHRLYHCCADLSLIETQGIALHTKPMLRYYRGFNGYWKAIARELKQANVNFSAAAGSNPLIAKACAMGHTVNTSPIKDNKFATVHLTQTDLEPKVIQGLERIGIRYLSDLLAIPLPELADRLDSQSIDYLRQLTDKKPIKLARFSPSDYFFARRELNYPCQSSEGLLAWLPELLEALQLYLRQRAQLARELILRLYFCEQTPLQIKILSNKGTQCPKTWLRLLSLKLENLSLEHPFHAFSLEARNNQASKENSDLFGQHSGTPINELLSLLQARLPPDAFSWPQAGNDHRPELSGNAQPLSQTVSLPLRPAFLTEKPPTLVAPVVIISGPERITTGWWDDKPVLRDYYIVRDKKGRWLWAYRELGGIQARKAWYLHGYFS
ncbi:DNA polymerase Y family protein [Gilvimarinus sp. DA14]|uniref:Y-family DNA polymerase n=1 Tax=Gilvimarinus sp. DA14 TaxID=2956798 RepID=UPI0020B8F633|nr:DNA polymerase Y family protein [Gilvimarinus sp. DA14]UTF60514.1 DNA polymerase Y family protein [Gilvimarinus sp. DA14]